MKVTSLLFLLVACTLDRTPQAKLNRQIQQCYEESDSVYEKPPVEGVMEFDLQIVDGGKPKTVKMTKSDFKKDRNLEACVYGIMKQTTIENGEKNKSYTHHEVVNFQAKKK